MTRRLPVCQREVFFKILHLFWRGRLLTDIEVAQQRSVVRTLWKTPHQILSDVLFC